MFFCYRQIRFKIHRVLDHLFVRWAFVGQLSLLLREYLPLNYWRIILCCIYIVIWFIVLRTVCHCWNISFRATFFFIFWLLLKLKVNNIATNMKTKKHLLNIIAEYEYWKISLIKFPFLFWSADCSACYLLW